MKWNHIQVVIVLVVLCLKWQSFITPRYLWLTGWVEVITRCHSLRTIIIAIGRSDSEPLQVLTCSAQWSWHASPVVHYLDEQLKFLCWNGQSQLLQFACSNKKACDMSWMLPLFPPQGIYIPHLPVSVSDTNITCIKYSALYASMLCNYSKPLPVLCLAAMFSRILSTRPPYSVSFFCGRARNSENSFQWPHQTLQSHALFFPPVLLLNKALQFE